MMDNIALREFLQKKYETPEAFLENVIYPVFGEENYDTSGNYHWLRRHPEDQAAADSAGILDILVLGSIFVEGSQLDIFDVTVASKRQLANSRVGIQQLIRRIISTHSGAFIIFHYKSSDRWDWRVTFCHKGASQLDSTDAKRYTFLLGPGQSCRTAADNFCKLGKTVSETGSFTMKDVIEAFDVEALSIEFFGKYKEQYERFVSYMADERNGMRANFIETGFSHDGLTPDEIRSREEKPLRDYVKKLLGRIVFLYFIQKKGWLGVEPSKDWGEGDLDFMLHLFEKASDKQKANFLDVILEPLFEMGLNTNRSEDDYLFDTGIKALPNGGVIKIPYLNGGLFERDASDEPDTVFPAEYFESLLTFLSQYNFTIDENDPNDAQVGIDPEMLGRIFENLLEDNKDKGTYYTPKEIVQYMCQESLIAYLQTDIGEEDKQCIRNFVLSYDVNLLSDKLKSELDQKLRAVKVCDPAIGSGAFPMGILKEIFFCRGAIENFEDAAKIKKEIINNNLYGVDIEKGAVDIARLRFWLAIVVDETTPTALPNLDYKIMQGNSLLESYNRIDLSHLLDDTGSSSSMDGGLFGNADIIEDTREELKQYRDEYFSCQSHEEKLVIKKDIQTAIKIQMSGRNIDVDFDGLDIAGNKEFFLWHTWFSEVFSNPDREKKGFDIVIGNPPYIDSETMTRVMPQTRAQYASLFSTARGNWDIYIIFYEQGMKLLNLKGKLSYITPNKWLSIGYGKALRQLYFKSIDSLCDCQRIKVFEAGNEPTICSLSNTENGIETITVSRYETDYTHHVLQSIPKSKLTADDLGVLLSEHIDLLMKIKGQSRHISDYIDSENPFSTGEAYDLIPLVEDKPFVAGENYKLINTGTIDPYISLWGLCRTSYLKGKYQFPTINRKQFGQSFPRRVRQAAAPKIIISGMRYFEAFWDEKGDYIAGKSTIILLNPVDRKYFKVLLGILNSKLISFYLKQSFSTLGIGGGINFSNDMVAAIPVPLLEDSVLVEQIDYWVNVILNITRRNPDIEDFGVFQDYSRALYEIEKRVSRLYHLSLDEVREIDNATTISENDLS